MRQWLWLFSVFLHVLILTPEMPWLEHLYQPAWSHDWSYLKQRSCNFIIQIRAIDSVEYLVYMFAEFCPGRDQLTYSANTWTDQLLIHIEFSHWYVYMHWFTELFCSEFSAFVKINCTHFVPMLYPTTLYIHKYIFWANKAPCWALYHLYDSRLYLNCINW